MIRYARAADMPRMTEIRMAVRENRLLRPELATPEIVLWFIENAGTFVWEEDGRIVGFSAADPRDGSIWALFMEEAYEGRGIGQALFARACAVLRDAGHRRLWLTTQQGSRAERFYRRAGWSLAGVEGGDLIFVKFLAPDL